jgi:hypothetical protein
MSFWSSDSRSSYPQKSIAIPAENGKEFNQNAKIVIVVPPDVSFFQPSESYLQFRVLLNRPSDCPATRLQLDTVLGGQVLLKHIRILTGTGTLISECQDYNVLANIINSYDTDRNIRNKRGVTEGTNSHNPSCRVDTSNVEETTDGSCNHNQYFDTPPDGNSSQQWAKLQIPIQTSIFRSKKIFPVVMTSGLRVEITLEEAKKCIKNLITTTNLTYSPKLYGVDKDNQGIASGAKSSTIALAKSNNITSVETCPFIVGEEIMIGKSDKTNSEKFGIITAITCKAGTADGGTDGYVYIAVASQYTFTKKHDENDRAAPAARWAREF